MSKLIFNPKKDMKELGKYGFKYSFKDGIGRYIEQTNQRFKLVIIESNREILTCKFGMYSNISGLLFKLIIENLVLEVE